MKKLLLIVLVSTIFFTTSSVTVFAANTYPYPNATTCPNACQTDDWAFYKRECTSYVAFKLNEAGIAFSNGMSGPKGTDGLLFGNGENWNNHGIVLGFNVDTNPSFRKVAVWEAAYHGAGPVGHVAYVEAVAGSSVTISDYNYYGSHAYDIRTFVIPSNSSPSNYLAIGISTPIQVQQVSGDYNNDGWDDLATFNPTTGHWKVRLSNNAPVSTSSTYDRDVAFGWSTTIPVGSFDYDGDGRHDLTIFDSASGRWYIRPSFGVTLGNASGVDDRNIVFGWSTTIPIGGGKYDSDRFNDLAIYDKSTGRWYIRPTNNIAGGNPTGVNDLNILFGWGGTLPLPGGDHDHDGRTDIAMYDTASYRWYVRPSMNVTGGNSSGANDWNTLFGGPTTVPKDGSDYNNDGWTDICIFDSVTGRWQAMLSGGGSLNVIFGWANAIPLAGGDYDKDHLTDLAFFDPATNRWYIRKSANIVGGKTDGTNDLNILFGSQGVIPI